MYFSLVYGRDIGTCVAERGKGRPFCLCERERAMLPLCLMYGKKRESWIDHILVYAKEREVWLDLSLVYWREGHGRHRLGVKTKIADEHPPPFHIGVPPSWPIVLCSIWYSRSRSGFVHGCCYTTSSLISQVLT